jgi:hypothetical protein
MDRLYSCSSCGIPEGGTHDVGCPNARTESREVIFYCEDCDGCNPAMHNSREVKRWWQTRPRTQRFPGFLCVPCWKAANPVLLELGSATKPPQRVNPAVIVWALFALCVICGAIASYLAK